MSTSPQLGKAPWGEGLCRGLRCAVFLQAEQLRRSPRDLPAIPPAISQVEQLKASPSLRLLAETHAEVLQLVDAWRADKQVLLSEL